MKPYVALTERGQARRLRFLALDALRHYNLDISNLRLVTNSLNGIFRIDTITGEKWILRISLPEGGHTLNHVLAEMDWLVCLRRDTDIPVPRPLPARDGSLVVEASAPGVPEPRLCAVFSWVPGTDLAEHITPFNMAKLGKLMARLHLHAQAYRPPAGLDLLHFDKVFPFPEPFILFEERFDNLYTPGRRLIYQRAMACAQQAIDRLKDSGEPMRMLHGDLHQWNVRISRGVLYPIDFEDLMLGWPVQDIATTLYYFVNMDEYSTLRAAFQEGYTCMASWPERYPGEIDAFIAARALGMANFVLNNPGRILGIPVPDFIQRIEKRLSRLEGLEVSL